MKNSVVNTMASLHNIPCFPMPELTQRGILVTLFSVKLLHSSQKISAPLSAGFSLDFSIFKWNISSWRGNYHCWNFQGQIRCGLLHNLREPVSQVATQLAVLIAKIARVDCPREWPNLLPSLFEAVKSNDDIVRHRSLLTLHHVIKQLASKRLAADRRTFQVQFNSYDLVISSFPWDCLVHLLSRVTQSAVSFQFL